MPLQEGGKRDAEAYGMRIFRRHRGEADSAFADTVPVDASTPVRAGWRRYVPNHVPVGERVAMALVAMTWSAWGAVGILSGHMFFLVSRRGTIHFSGLPALIFSGAVLACAAACLCRIVDHYDTRNNELAYKRLKRNLWWGAGVLFLISIVVAFAETSSILPWTDGSLGLLDGRSLRLMLASNRLARLLKPHAEAFQFWSLMSSFWFLLAGTACRKIGWLSEDHAQAARHPIRSVVLISVLALPPITTLLLALLTDFSTGEVATKAGLTEEQVKAQVAWRLSMLITCMAAGVFLLFVFCLVILRRLGAIPSLAEEQARKQKCPPPAE